MGKMSAKKRGALVGQVLHRQKHWRGFWYRLPSWGLLAFWWESRLPWKLEFYSSGAAVSPDHISENIFRSYYVENL